MKPRIVAYAYADPDGPEHGATFPPFASCSTFGADDGSGAILVRPLESLPFYAPESANDQLRAWAALLDTYAPGTGYSLVYDPVTRRVTLTSPVSTEPVLPENSALWTGFTGIVSGGSYVHSWEAADAPAAVCELLGVTVEPADESARVDLAQYRHGRVTAIGWGNHTTYAVTLCLLSSDVGIFDNGFLLTGRVRIVQGADANPISTVHPGGYVDGYVVASTELVEDGDIGELWTVNLLVAVPRG